MMPDDVSRTSDPLRGMRAPLGVLAGLMAVTLVGVVVAGVGEAVRRTDSPVPAASGTEMIEVAPGGVIDPADVPDALAVLYQAAHQHAQIYEQIPCFCGCQTMLGHRHLLDCFARPDGGWEAHALGCGVCLGEAQQVEALLAAGETHGDVIRTAIIGVWGDPYRSG